MTKLMDDITVAVALIDRAAQIGSDKLETWQEGMVCSFDTTIMEMYEWAKTRIGLSGPRCAPITIIFAEKHGDEV